MFDRGSEKGEYSDMKMPLSKDQISYYAECYLDLTYGGVTNRTADQQIESTFKRIRQRGYVTLDELKDTANWFSKPFLIGKVSKNTSEHVESVTREAFAAASERERVTLLQDLYGVSWSMASVILHFAIPQCHYPIISKYVTTTIETSPVDSLARWLGVTEFLREKSTEYGVGMRKLDQALWAYSEKRKQRS